MIVFCPSCSRRNRFLLADTPRKPLCARCGARLASFED
jgi:hypothetical protein